MKFVAVKISASATPLKTASGNPLSSDKILVLKRKGIAQGIAGSKS